MRDTLNQIHSSHKGIGGCVRRAREILYWPGTCAEIRDFASRCSTCQTYRPAQAREVLNPHELPSRPLGKGCSWLSLLIRVRTANVPNTRLDYYWANYFEVGKIRQKTAQAVITQLKVHFARHGIPAVLITDNGPEFLNEEVRKFAKEWKFDHRTSSPRYPQSNGKAENAVKTSKGLLLKSLLAILHWRNTPRRGFGTSPAQRLMGSRTRRHLQNSFSHAVILGQQRGS